MKINYPWNGAKGTCSNCHIEVILESEDSPDVKKIQTGMNDFEQVFICTCPRCSNDITCVK